MKRNLTALLSIILAICLMLSFVSCGEAQGEQGEQGEQGIQGERGEKGEKGEKGEQGESGIQGAPGQTGETGKDGATPTISVSDDGYWVINGVKTEHKAIGVDGEDGEDGKDGDKGDTPTIAIDNDGYWVINGKKTEYKAIGKDGEDGDDGKTPTIEISDDGYWIINDKKTEYKAIGVDGKNGEDGEDGKNGKDGTSTTITIDSDGYWVINGEKTEYKAVGEDGEDGDDGKTPTIEISDDGYWIIDGKKTDYKAEPKICEHTYGAYVKEFEGVGCVAICVEKAVCTKCGDTSQKFTQINNHSYISTVIAATCAEYGYTLYECENCDSEYKDQFTEKVQHNYEDFCTLISTCKSYEKLRKCTVCEDLKLIRLEPENNHKFVNRKCIYCGIDEAGWSGSVATSFSGGSGTETDPYLISSGEELAFLAHVVNTGAQNGEFKYYKNLYYKLTNDIDLNGLEWDPIGCYYYDGGHKFAGCFDGDGHSIYNMKITEAKDPLYRNFGLFGFVSGTIENVYLTDFSIDMSLQLTSAGYVGGIAGRLEGGSVKNCHAKGNISVVVPAQASLNELYVGGLVGFGTSGSVGTITDCSMEGSVTVNSDAADNEITVGGLIGYYGGGTISNCYAISDVKVIATTTTTQSPSVTVGGLVGSSWQGTIENCYAKGKIVAQCASNAEYNLAEVGGLAGSVGAQKHIISNSYAEVDMIVSSQTIHVGGLTGASNGTIEECYAIGDIKASGSQISSGELSGAPVSGSTISDCYSFIYIQEITVTE